MSMLDGQGLSDDGGRSVGSACPGTLTIPPMCLLETRAWGGTVVSLRN